MRKRLNMILIILIGLCLVKSTYAAQVSTGTYKSADGNTIVVSASEIAWLGINKIVLNGKSHIKSFSNDTKASMDAQADKIVVTLFSSPASKNKTGQQSLFKSADLTGSPKIVYSTVDPATGNTMTTTTTSNSANYDGIEQLAYLKGNVKIVNENPAIFSGPAVMTGDEATINTKPNLSPDEERFRIISSPGISKIEVTPKSKEEAKPKN